MKDENYRKFYSNRIMTSSDHSTYYFRIFTKNDYHFEQDLNRLLQFFYIPFFNEFWIEEIIRKIDLEAQQIKLQKHESWFQYFERFIVNSTHPYLKHDLCKKEILEELTTKTIQSRLKNFFSTHYSANIMTMCIVSGCKRL